MIEALEPRLLLTAAAAPELYVPYLPPQFFLSQPGGYLSDPSSGEAIDIAMSYLAGQADLLQVQPADILQSAVTNLYTSADTGVTHIYLRQQLGGLDVINANLSINIAADGSPEELSGSLQNKNRLYVELKGPGPEIEHALGALSGLVALSKEDKDISELLILNFSKRRIHH